jgi:carboxyl-terminal processing protease
MRSRFPIWMMGVAALLSGCGGENNNIADSGGSSSGGATGGTCSLLSRQNWAAGVLNEWYLFPETLPSPTLSPASYTTVDDYVDALTATARGQRKDRFFTYVTSIAEENAFFNSGSSAGFGIRLSYDTPNRRVTVTETFEGTSALTAGIDRGTEILAIGNDANSLRNVSDIMAASGAGGVSDALGPSTVGTTRTLRVSAPGGAPRVVTISKTDYTLSPVSTRYGAKVITDNGRQIGYLNLRTFISTADGQLRTAISNFRAQGITNIVVDFRYNGGGLINTAELMGDLLGGNRSTSEVFSRETFRPSKSANNSEKRFAANANSASPVKLAFIGTGATASASELVINGMAPFYGQNLALIGGNTFGKPVGQIGIDRAACDDRMRVIALATQNGAGQANYFDGLATTLAKTCRAADDLTKPLGDPTEASLRQALNWIAGVGTCTPIAGAQQAQSVSSAPRMLSPAAPTAAQREVPGLF